ncbi:alpha-N-acetylgalactosaminide alpha-2,6-sialyltransferase 1-like isoform X2 [Astyanax mexicanus]|uniref:alpha-N-acetylgalactosaminide alpha-2,6-sialyltransferase 1-like isoform X2 n=1 Tax=Astyanax mexicanus TaxID=7994 RepID=UPI0020CB0FF3|nr:alpha-N-acetylgalactosaminide alpha-2,6-sialyltransferase 1-like isoform X2 [Astyanax mexicanus]
MKTKCPAVTPFRFTLIILYIIFTAWVYTLYTRSVNFREEFKNHPTALKKTTTEDPKDPGRSTAGIQINKALLNQTEPKPSTIPPSDQRALTVIPVMFKKNFKMMPYWELNGVYLRGEEAFQTVCAESLRKSKNEDFQKAFIPNIKMYLYQNQLNLSEWNRLSHFNNPFGFMEYNYTDIKSAVDLIQKPNITQLLPLPANESCIRCAVVANGGILNGSKMGKEIDSHTYVFRMNGAVIEGHEEDVGNRTSVYVHTSFSLIASLIAYRKYGFKNVPNDEGIKFVMIPEGLRDFIFLKDLLNRKAGPDRDFKKKKRAWAYYGGQFDESRFYVLHPDFLRYIRNRFMTSKQQNGTYWAMYRPTNGAFTLFLALHVCDIVDAYGFITENHKSFSNYYYENKKTEVVFFINHDYNLEIKLWKKLHDDKLIRLYQREGGQT